MPPSPPCVPNPFQLALNAHSCLPSAPCAALRAAWHARMLGARVLTGVNPSFPGHAQPHAQVKKLSGSAAWTPHLAASQPSTAEELTLGAGARLTASARNACRSPQGGAQTEHVRVAPTPTHAPVAVSGASSTATWLRYQLCAGSEWSKQSTSMCMGGARDVNGDRTMLSPRLVGTCEALFDDAILVWSNHLPAPIERVLCGEVQCPGVQIFHA